MSTPKSPILPTGPLSASKRLSKEEREEIRKRAEAFRVEKSLKREHHFLVGQNWLYHGHIIKDGETWVAIFPMLEGATVNDDIETKRDAEFFLHAHKDIPALLEALDEAERESERLREGISAALDFIPDGTEASRFLYKALQPSTSSDVKAASIPDAIRKARGGEAPVPFKGYA